MAEHNRQAIKDILQNLDEEVRETWLAVHTLLLDTLPGVDCSLDCSDRQAGYGARQYGYRQWATLAFMRGPGKKVRHVKVRSRKDFQQKKEALQQLILEASRLA